MDKLMQVVRDALGHSLNLLSDSWAGININGALKSLSEAEIDAEKSLDGALPAMDKLRLGRDLTTEELDAIVSCVKSFSRIQGAVSSSQKALIDLYKANELVDIESRKLRGNQRALHWQELIFSIGKRVLTAVFLVVVVLYSLDFAVKRDMYLPQWLTPVKVSQLDACSAEHRNGAAALPLFFRRQFLGPVQ